MVILQFAICVSQGHLIHDCSVVFSPPFGSATMWNGVLLIHDTDSDDTLQVIWKLNENASYLLTIRNYFFNASKNLQWLEYFLSCDCRIVGLVDFEICRLFIARIKALYRQWWYLGKMRKYLSLPVPKKWNAILTNEHINNNNSFPEQLPVTI